jgi:hypothetical protein
MHHALLEEGITRREKSRRDDHSRDSSRQIRAMPQSSSAPRRQNAPAIRSR